MGNQYKDTITDLARQSGTVGACAPRTPSEGSNRHCAAWEQVSAALKLVADCMDMMGCPNAEAVRKLADESIMEKNRGE